MAVTRTGSVTFITSVSRSSTSAAFTCPSDAILMIAGLTGFSSTANMFSGGSLTWNGVSMSVGRADDASTSLDMSCLFYLKAPTTGNQTLSWTWLGSGNLTLGAHFFVGFYLGNDTTTPIKSSGGQAVTGSDTATAGTLTAASGDLAVAIAEGANTGTNPTGFTWTNLTQASTDGSVGEFSGYAENSPSGNTTYTAQQTGGTATFFTNISAIVIAQAGAPNTIYGADITPISYSWR